MCHLRNIAMPDYQENVTRQTHRQTEGQTVIPMCHYASRAILSIKVTMSMNLLSFERVSLVEFVYQCMCEVSNIYGPKVMAKIKVFFVPQTDT